MSRFSGVYKVIKASEMCECKQVVRYEATDGSLHKSEAECMAKNHSIRQQKQNDKAYEILKYCAKYQPAPTSYGYYHQNEYAQYYERGQLDVMTMLKSGWPELLRMLKELETEV